MDKIAEANKRMWEELVKDGTCGYTIPWLNLSIAEIADYTSERVASPHHLREIYPYHILSEVEGGTDVLCLASGGGQQSVVLGLLGASVTVVDLTPGQLDGDIEAARHYGYEAQTIRADMRDLSSLEPTSFDLVYQGNSIGYVPDVIEVFEQVATVLKRDGHYRVDFHQSAVAAVEWNGSSYCVARPYHEKVHHREDGGIEFRHYYE